MLFVLVVIVVALLFYRNLMFELVDCVLGLKKAEGREGRSLPAGVGRAAPAVCKRTRFPAKKKL